MKYCRFRCIRTPSSVEVGQSVRLMSDDGTEVWVLV